MYESEEGKVTQYSHNQLSLPTYDPWVGIRIALMFCGILMYHTVRFIYRTACVPDSTLSHYERFRKYHRQTVRNSIWQNLTQSRTLSREPSYMGLPHTIVSSLDLATESSNNEYGPILLQERRLSMDVEDGPEQTLGGGGSKLDNLDIWTRQGKLKSNGGIELQECHTKTQGKLKSSEPIEMEEYYTTSL